MGEYKSKEMIKQTLDKYLNNSCSEEDLNEVIQWLKTEALSAEGKKIGLEDWKTFEDQTRPEEDGKFSLLFDKIQDKINENGNSSLSVFVNWMSKAAAILLLPVLAFLFYTLSEKKIESDAYAEFKVDSVEISAPIGSKAAVNLSDGSVVHLNYGSKIKYPKFFTGNNREIELIGEAYFDVAHNPDKPFIVNTGNMSVKALGTAFNVLAYPGDDIIETTLVNGKVVLEKNNFDGKNKTIGALVPGQHVKYNLKTETTSSTIGKIEKYIAWKEGKLVFQDTPITQVAEKLGRMFNVEIEVADNAIDNFYTVTFIDEPLFQILDMITLATPQLTYKAYPRKKLADGTFSKQRIQIMKR